MVTYHSLLFLFAGFGAPLKVHRAQPGVQEGRRKSAAPLNSTLGPAVNVQFSIFSFKVAGALELLFWVFGLS